MEFPPISSLISATFDELNPKEAPNAPAVAPAAPQPVANAEGIGGEQPKLGVNSGATSPTNRVGTVLDTVA